MTKKVIGIKVINKIDKFCANKLKRGFAEVQGSKMFIGNTDVAKLSIFGVLEPLETNLFKKSIKGGNIVLDIGANIGYYTLIAAKLVGEKGRVYAFEPDKDNFEILKKNVAINGYKNIILINKAVSNKTEKLKLYISEKDMGSHSLYKQEKNQKFVLIDSIKLDDFFKDEKINVIKIDIEGAEFKAFKGMNTLLSQNDNLKIFMEYHPIMLKKSGINPKEFLISLIKEGFKLYDIDEQQKRVYPVILRKFIKKYNKKKGNNSNLFCIRKKDLLKQH